LIQIEPAKTWILSEGVSIIGRRITSTICIECHSVSREHARIEQKGKRWFLTDLGGTNGTFLRGVPVKGSVTLHHGDTLRFGQQEVRFENEAEDPTIRTDSGIDTHTMMSQPESLMVTMLVADLEGFTAMAATMPSDHLAAALRSWCDGCRRVLQLEGAVLDKFIGDGVFAWWSGTTPDIRARALSAARAILALAPPAGSPSLPCGAALHCAKVALCRMPDATFTLLGAEVNTAFRVESLTRLLRQPLLVTEAFAKDLPPNIATFTDCGTHQLKGIPQPVTVMAVVPIEPA